MESSTQDLNSFEDDEADRFIGSKLYDDCIFPGVVPKSRRHEQNVNILLHGKDHDYVLTAWIVNAGTYTVTEFDLMERMYSVKSVYDPTPGIVRHRDFYTEKRLWKYSEPDWGTHRDVFKFPVCPANEPCLYSVSLGYFGGSGRVYDDPDMVYCGHDRVVDPYQRRYTAEWDDHHQGKITLTFMLEKQ